MSEIKMPKWVVLGFVIGIILFVINILLARGLGVQSIVREGAEDAVIRSDLTFDDILDGVDF